VRKEIWEIDKDQPISGVGSMSHILSESVSRQRFNLLLMVIFASLSLLLAAGGLFGVTFYAVAQSTREIGIRIALGARKADVLKVVIRQGMMPVLMGVMIGLAASLALTRLMTSLLFGVSATDPLTYGVIVLLLTAVALAACYIPARRAAKVDPMVALRYE
jgi:putative ABC transport system permease protein